MSTATPRERFILKAGPGRGTTSRAAWLPTTNEMPEEVPTRRLGSSAQGTDKLQGPIQSNLA